jgi:type I restriction enzyme S subunit
MKSEWPLRPLGELTINLDGRRKPVKGPDRIAGPYPYYGASGIVDWVDDYLFEGEHLLIAEDGENLRTRNTPIAFRATDKFWVNNHAHIVRGNDEASTRFLEYAVLGTDISAYLTGAVMPKLTRGSLNKIRVPCPPLSVQQEIVEILGALDDKASLLRQTSATLEAIAQAIFKSWFIDFDPVHAKAKGIAPEGMDEATLALFPDSLEETTLGLIPAGWQDRTIDDVAHVVKGKSYTSAELVDEHHTALVTLKSFQRKGGFRMDGFKPYSGKYKPEQVVRAGDLVIAYTDVTQAAELIARPALVIGVSDYSTLVASLDVGVIRPRTNELGRLFLHARLKAQDFLSHALSRTSGTTVLHLAKDGVADFRFACPPLELANAYENS